MRLVLLSFYVRFYFLSTLVGLLASSTTFASITFTLVPLREIGVSEINQLIKHNTIVSNEPVFSTSEQAALKQMGRGYLAQSYRVEIETLKAAAELRDWVSRFGLDVKIEENSLAIRMLDEPLEEMQWALHNTGANQSLQVDDLTSTILKGKIGEDIDLRGVPQENLNGKPVRVAILDTGVDYEHPNLKPHIVRNSAECAALQSYQDCLRKESNSVCDQKWANVDADKNGYPLDCSGWNVTAGRNPITDVYGSHDASDNAGHGTHLAGIIAAGANGTGVRGVSQNVEILPVKVIQSGPNGPIRPQSDTHILPPTGEKNLHWTVAFADIIARGMLYAIRSHAQIINMSLAWPAGADSALMREMVALAVEQGILVVAAAGNDSSDSRVMPCQYDGVICVASHDSDGGFSYFSNYGSCVDTVAPGTGVLSTWPMSMRSINYTAMTGYETKNGTSMSSPFVVGVLARLIAAGISPQESYARLILGARPTSLPGKKYTRSGNVDLGNSFRISPQALILPEKKLPIQLAWDRKSLVLPLSLPLKNFWVSTQNVHITAEVLQESGMNFAHLGVSQWDISDWSAATVQSLESQLVIDDVRVDGRLSVELKVTVPGGKPAVFRIPIEIAVEITPNFLDPEVKVLPIAGGVVKDGYSLRSVTVLDNVKTQDYFALDETSGSRKFQLIERKESNYQITAEGALDALQGDLLLIQRINLKLDGSRHYAFVYKTPPVAGGMPGFSFRVYDGKLNLEQKIDYENKTSVISERFQWMQVKNGESNSLVPVWMSYGKTPDLDLPPSDPWNPTPDDPPFLRLYYLASEGLHSVNVPDLYALVQILSQSAEQKAKGTVTVVLSQGDDYKLSYFLAELKGDGVDTSSVRALSLTEYRMLLGVDTVSEVTPLDSLAQVSGTFFSGTSAHGSQRTTVIQTSVRGSSVPSITDQIQEPPSVLDSVVKVSGVFLGGHREAVIAQTHYQIEYQDFNTGQQAYTALDRFSFLPSYIFGSTLFPVAAATASGQDRLPGIMIPATLGVSDSIEVVLPVYDSDEKLLGLSHAARFRLKSTSGCSSLGNSIAPDSVAPSQIMFFCGDRFLQIPIQY